jgi:hypothetical protein
MVAYIFINVSIQDSSIQIKPQATLCQHGTREFMAGTKRAKLTNQILLNPTL